MSNFTFILPTPDASRPGGSASPRSSSKSHAPHEQFDSVMGRFLARKGNGTAASRASARSSAKRKEKADTPVTPANSPDATDTAIPEQAAAAATLPAEVAASACAAPEGNASSGAQTPTPPISATLAAAADLVGAVPGGPQAGAENGKPGAASSGVAALMTAAGVSPEKTEQQSATATAKTLSSAEPKSNEGPAPPTGKQIAAETASTASGRDGPSDKSTAKDSGGHQLRVEVVSQTMAGTSAMAGLDPRGISVAQQALAMKKAENMHESAGLSEQNLPVGSATRALSGQSGGNEISAAAAASSFSHEITSADRSGGILVAADSTVSTRAIERAQELISLQATRLRDSGGDALQVVIKPGSGLQLSLNLQMHGKQIEVQAMLDRGDFHLLSRHWPELQQQLETRGIHLAPLTINEHTGGSSAENYQQSNERATRDDAAPIADFAKFTAAGSPAMRPISPGAKSLRGWESWA